MKSFTSSDSTSRRSFMAMMAAAGAGAILPVKSFPSVVNRMKNTWTVGAVMDMILKTIPGAPFKETVDTLKAGSKDQEVTGIITTMFPTVDVLRQAIARKANFLIVHEPSYYSHTDSTDWLSDNWVYNEKRALIDMNKLAIWRFHDYWHAHIPDGILMGVVTSLGWEKYYNASNPQVFNPPAMSLKNLIDHAKKSLGIAHVKVIGDLSQQCTKIALLPGACGGNCQINMIKEQRPDVLLCGEVHEWETAEFVRDLRALGHPTALVILGHSVSEEPGMKWLSSWLSPKVEGISVTHIPSQDPFLWL